MLIATPMSPGPSAARPPARFSVRQDASVPPESRTKHGLEMRVGGACTMPMLSTVGTSQGEMGRLGPQRCCQKSSCKFLMQAVEE